jgi:hypothetical protein
MSLLELTGRARSQLVQVEQEGGAPHAEMAEPSLAISAAAPEDGIGIAVFSRPM